MWDGGHLTTWLHTTERRRKLRVGGRSHVSTEPPRDRATGAFRRRKDGEPYMPAWRWGDEIVSYHPASGRRYVLEKLTGGPVWDDAEQVWKGITTVLAYNPAGGPTPKDMLIKRVVQGGRQRLTPLQRNAALRHFRPALSSDS